MTQSDTQRDRLAVHPPPPGLGDRGLLIWAGIASTYALRVDEWSVLLDACREADLADRLEVELRTSALIVRGAYGNVMPNPVLVEIRQHRAASARLLAQLKLPDPARASNDPERDSVERARHAARVRWDRSRPEGRPGSA